MSTWAARARTTSLVLAAALVLPSGTGGFAEVVRVASAGHGGLEEPSSIGNLSREQLRDHRVTLVVEPGQWATVRVFRDRLVDAEGDAWFGIGVEPPRTGHAYVATSAWEPQLNLPQSTYWDAIEGRNDSTHLGVNVSGGPSEEVDPEQSPQYLFVLGANGGPSTFHLGLFDPDDPPADGPGVVDELTDRAPLEVRADHVGSGGAAGIVHVTETPVERHVEVAGQIEADIDAGLVPGVSVQDTIRVSGSGTQSSTGIGGFRLRTGGTAGVNEWSYDLELGDLERSDEGRGLLPHAATGIVNTYVPPTQAHGLQDGRGYLSARVGEGPVSLEAQGTFTGAAREFLVEWGWTTADPVELYGWEWSDWPGL